MADDPSGGGGLFSGVRRILGTALDLVRNRVELASVEWEEERWRLLDLLARVALVVVLGTLALATATATVIYLLWPWSPMLALGGVTLAYAAGAAWALHALRRQLRTGPRPFADTRAALKKDVQWLRGND